MTVAVTSRLPPLTGGSMTFAESVAPPIVYMGDTGTWTVPSVMAKTSPTPTALRGGQTFRLGPRVDCSLLEGIVHGLAIVPQPPLRPGHLRRAGLDARSQDLCHGGGILEGDS